MGRFFIVIGFGFVLIFSAFFSFSLCTDLTVIRSILAEIVELEGEILSEKFGLEPRFCCSPNDSDNLLHLSPIILLEDLELRDGEFKDTSAKDVLSRVAKHNWDSKDPSLFQISEIPAFHMGYAKKPENKKRNMAIDHEQLS